MFAAAGCSHEKPWMMLRGVGGKRKRYRFLCVRMNEWQYHLGEDLYEFLGQMIGDCEKELKKHREW